uniref:Uncharacterized protein n=1 Tax=Salix viminalis TaxID=40686 RepID=A0A6N2L184_SALVM
MWIKGGGWILTMGVEERIDIAESSIGNELIEQEGDGMVVEPHDGMEFEAEDAAKIYRRNCSSTDQVNQQDDQLKEQDPGTLLFSSKSCYRHISAKSLAALVPNISFTGLSSV